MARGGNGGIGGSGIFGGIGTVVQCSASDNSIYCSLAKFVNMLFMILLLLYISYFALSFAYSFYKSGGKRGFRF